MIRLLFTTLLVMPLCALAQDLSVIKSDSEHNSLHAYYWTQGEPETKANLILSYSLPITELNIEQSNKKMLEQFAKSRFPKIFGVFEAELSEDQADKLAYSAEVEFRLIKGKKIYATCKAPKNLYGYGFSAGGHTNTPSDSYVSLTSNTLPINKIAYAGQKKPFNIRKDQNGRKTNPLIIKNDKIILLQNGRIVLTARFKGVPR